MLIWIANSKTWILIFTIMKTGFLNIKGLKFSKMNFYFIYYLYLYLKRKIQISSIKMPLSQSFDSCESFCFRQPLKLFIIIIKGKNFLFSCLMLIILLLFNLISYIDWHKHANLKAISPGASSSKQIKAYYQCICLFVNNLSS